MYYKIFLIFVALATILCSVTAYAAEPNENAENIENEEVVEYTEELPEFDPNSTFTGQTAYTESLSGFVYEELEDGTCIVVGYNEKESDITVPQTIGDLTVTAIGETAFYGKAYLKSVILPASVTSIGDDAFGDCIKLTSIEMPGVTYIGHEAFSGCEMLMSLELPQSLTFIGDSAFEGCLRIGKLTVPPTLTEIGMDAFLGCESLILDCTANEAAAEYADRFSIATSFTETGEFRMILGIAVSALLLIGFAAVRHLTVKKAGK